MTSVTVPKFVLSLMENEMIGVIEKTLESVSRCTSVPIERLRKEVEKDFDIKLRIIPIQEEELKISKVRPRKVIPDDCRCEAQVKKGPIMKACSFAKIDGCKYCKRHEKKYGGEVSSKDKDKDTIVEKAPAKIVKVRKVF